MAKSVVSSRNKNYKQERKKTLLHKKRGDKIYGSYRELCLSIGQKRAASGSAGTKGNLALDAGPDVARKRRRCDGGDERGRAVAEVLAHGASRGPEVG